MTKQTNNSDKIAAFPKLKSKWEWAKERRRNRRKREGIHGKRIKCMSWRWIRFPLNAYTDIWCHCFDSTWNFSLKAKMLRQCFELNRYSGCITTNIPFNFATTKFCFCSFFCPFFFSIASEFFLLMSFSCYKYFSLQLEMLIEYK